MMTTLKTFRGFKTVEFEHALEEAKDIIRELTANRVVARDRWVQWEDDDDNSYLLTYRHKELNLNISRTISVTMKLTWKE